MAQASEVLVDIVHHPRVHLHIASENLFLLSGETFPVGHIIVFFGVGLRQDGIGRDQADLLLAFVAGLAHGVPASLVFAFVAGDVRVFGLQGRMDCRVRQIHEERLARMRSAHFSHHLYGTVGEVVGEVVAVGVLIHVQEAVAFYEAVGMVEVGEAAEDAVELIEPSLQRPRVAVARRVLVGLFAEMPFAEHESGVAVVSQDLGEGGAVVREFQSVAGEAGVAVRHMPYSGIVRVEAGQQRSSGGRAHRVHMEVGVLQAGCCQSVEMGRCDLAAVAAEVGIAEVVAEDHDYIRRVLGGGGRLRPMRLAACHRSADPASEPRIGRQLVVCFRCCDVYLVFSHALRITHGAK